MNAFDNRPFQHQQQNMMNHQQNQFASQLSNAVLRNSVGPNPGMMSSFGGGNQDQPVVMVVPQSQATGGMMGGGNMGNMGHMMSSQNPFAAAVMNQQKPMQVIVGNMPGLNPAAFGQQVLPAYGQGVGEQSMGMYGQQGQQGSSNRFGRDNKNSSDRGRINQRNQKVTLVRRTEANDRGRIGTPRGVAKKRVIVGGREQYVDPKKAKVTVVARNRVGVLRKDRMKTRRNNKAGAGNKTGVKSDEKKDDKEKSTPNGNAAAAEGDAKTGEAAAAESADSGEKKPCKYIDIPAELLVCKICRKTFGDGPAFESHLTEKLHTTLMKILEEKFSKRAQILMFESKMCEDELAVQMDRPRRSGKNQGKASKTHCKMCDCSYTVNWGTHKQSVWHRVLKEFLHPNCRFCKSQFVHRKDYIEHIMSPAHKKKLIELKQEGKVYVTDQESTLQEELFAVHIELTKEEKLLNIVNVHSLGGQQPLTDDIKSMLQGENGEIQLPTGEIKIPENFDENVAFGEDAIFKVGGSCCKVCRIYISEGEDSDHCKSRQHFDSYVEYLKRVVRLREQKAAEERKAQEEAEKKAKAEADAAAKAAEDAKKAAEAATNAAAAATEKNETAAAAASSTDPKSEMEVDEKPAASANVADEAVEPNAEESAADETMEEDQAAAAEEKVATSPAKGNEAAKTTPTPNKTPQRGGQQSRGARGSPARGRGQPGGRGGGGYRGGRGGGQQPQTPARGGATPRGNNNARGGRGGQARGGARGSPGRGRGRGW